MQIEIFYAERKDTLITKMFLVISVQQIVD